MNRVAVVVALLAALAGVGLMLALSPRTGEPPAPEAAVEELAPSTQIVTSPTPPQFRPTPVPYEVRADGTAGPVFREPTQSENAGLDPNQEFAADAKGVTTAAISRRGEITRCLKEYWGRAGERGYGGRFTLEITVDPADDGGADVSTEVVNGPEDQTVRDCVSAALDGARFATPEHRVMVRWPVPMAEDFAN